MADETNVERVPALAGWITAGEVAEILGVSRQRVNRMVTTNEFKTVRRLGKRPILIFKENEVRDLAEKRLTQTRPTR